jgi:NAD(P)-dependent dehydrogenase (short-subunit alcohol dehydrogenase family)
LAFASKAPLAAISLGVCNMSARLLNKVALVTGGSSGIGRATALAFARQGARVLVADLAVEGGEETVRTIKSRGGEATFIKTDVSQPAEAEAMVKRTVATYGRLDCAFNNAGIAGARGTFVDYPEEEWEQIIRINLKGVWLCMKYELRQMLAQGSGAIVNTASTMAVVGSPNACAYTAASHGIAGLVKCAALEYAKKNIRINAVCPGVIRTPLIEALLPPAPGNDRAKVETQLAARSPMERMGTPEEIAAAVVWLCSDDASFVNGALLPLDGGFLAG